MNYYFFHIPKTGGTSFKRAFESWMLTARDLDLSPLARRELKDSNADICVVGHFGGLLAGSEHGLLNRYPFIVGSARDRVVTFLRDPLDQAISFYYHECRAGNDIGDLQQFLSRRNKYAYRRAFGLTRVDQIDAALASFWFIGVTEQLQESIDLIARRLGRKKPRAAFENRRASSEADISLTAAERRRFEKLYDIEYELYDRVRNAALDRIADWNKAEQFVYVPQVRACALTHPPEPGAAAFISSLFVHTGDGHLRSRFRSDERIGVTIEFSVLAGGLPIEPCIEVSQVSAPVFRVAYNAGAGAPQTFRPGSHIATAWIPEFLLNTGRFEIEAALVTPSPFRQHARMRLPAQVLVVDDPAAAVSVTGSWRSPLAGALRPRLEWCAR